MTKNQVTAVKQSFRSRDTCRGHEGMPVRECLHVNDAAIRPEDDMAPILIGLRRPPLGLIVPISSVGVAPAVSSGPCITSGD